MRHDRRPLDRTRSARRIQAAQREWADAVGREVGVDDPTAANRILARVLDALP